MMEIFIPGSIISMYLLGKIIPYIVHRYLAPRYLNDTLTTIEYNSYTSSIVATTRHSRTNDLTTSKALQWTIK